ncbi:DUF177 domain-containing protein [Salibaculum sp.]|uniref:YceD family protein n=1 Tax=Salibaculum sp. TaxID=2855480 RepID=UPI002B48D68B|nr:DUF177 domain-containing protein [Salibaculum sp.]HKL70469.1 DUF177 domain-containing protein [Salibaculum sp.]
MPDPATLPEQIIRLSELPARKPHRFALDIDPAACAAVAAALGIRGVRKLRFAGALYPKGGRDWLLQAELGATVMQDCVVTLDPVTTRIDEELTRAYLADLDPPEGTEVEIPEDESAEPLPAALDLGQVMIEALALALPPYPRAAGAETGEAVFTEPGKAPLRDADLRPFAGLAGLRDALDAGRDSDPDDPPGDAD